MVEPLRVGDPRVLGAYSVVARLGEGGMGAVFLGRSPGGRPVAIKTVRPEFAADAVFRRRFAVEVEAARRVGGFYTAQVVDADVEGDQPWLVTAYVPGPSLAEAVTAHGPLPARTVRALGAGLAEGLAAIHACGLVHRDLKPGNVILAADGPRVIDFGIAKAMDVTAVTANGVVGTPAFMSPEQARSADVGPASDVFSLGAVLAFALTGGSPFGSGPIAAVVYRLVQEEPDLTGVPVEFRELVAACLAKDPRARPTVARLLEVLGGADLAEGWVPEPVAAMIATHADGAASAGTRVDGGPPTGTRVYDDAPEPRVPGPVAAEPAGTDRRPRLFGRRKTRSAKALLASGVRHSKKGDVSAARRDLRQAADLGTGSTRAEALWHLGMLAKDEGDTEGADALFHESIATGDPFYVAASLYALYEAARRQGRFDEARRYLEKTAETRHPDWGPMAAWRLGLLLRDIGEIDKAVDWLQRAALTTSRMAAPGAAFDLGVIEEQRGDTLAARRWYEHAIAWDSPDQSPKAMLNLGVMLRETDLPQARTWLERAAATDHSLAAPWAALTLGSMAQGHGDIRSARHWLTKAAAGPNVEVARMAGSRLQQL